MRYKRLTKDDYEDILEISRHIWDGNDYLPKVFHKWVEDEEGYFIGVELEDKIVAVGKYTILKDGQGWLEGLRVHPSYRGRQLAHAVTDVLFNIAREDLKNKKITNIAMCTHKDTPASIKMMEDRKFKLEDSCMVVFKEYENLDKNMDYRNYKFEKWDITYEEFKELEIFKNNNNKIIGTFVFYNLCRDVYNELVRNNSLVKINGHECIVMKKDTFSIMCIENSFEPINICANYYLSKYKVREVEIYISNYDEDLIANLKANNYYSILNYEKDCVYYVYR